MSFNVSISVKGLEKFSNFSDKLKKESDNILSDALEKSSELIVSVAKQNAPVDTGALRDSIDKKTIKKNRVMIHDGVFYGIYQELGFWHKSGKWVQNPFLFPAVDYIIPQTKEQIKNKVNKLTSSLP